jgi:hypothetical protein
MQNALYYFMRLLGYHHGGRVPLWKLGDLTARAFQSGVVTRAAVVKKKMRDLAPDDAFDQFENGFELAANRPVGKSGGDEEWFDYTDRAPAAAATKKGAREQKESVGHAHDLQKESGEHAAEKKGSPRRAQPGTKAGRGRPSNSDKNNKNARD